MKLFKHIKKVGGIVPNLADRIRQHIADAQDGDTDGTLRVEVEQMREDFGSRLAQLDNLYTQMKAEQELLRQQVEHIAGNL